MALLQLVTGCAGVLYAKAGLQNFYDLALKVCQKLKLQKSEPAQKILRNIREIDKILGTTGIISMDKVFGLLEREFDSKTINAVAAESLCPPKKSIYQHIAHLLTWQ